MTVEVTEARFEADPTPALVVTGQGPRPAEVRLVGARAGARATPSGRGKTWKAVVTLVTARWGGPLLPLPSGEYSLSIVAAEGQAPAVVPDTRIPVRVLGTLRAGLADGVVTVGPPVDPVYASGEGQAALERRYVNRPDTVLENAVFFESFYGRNVSDNPLAIDRELSRLAPGVTRYWSVMDRSIPVPDGAVAVVEGSPQWWRARGGVRLLVVNDWLRRRFERRPGQHVVQTWHGTPLKRLALDRSGFHVRRAVAVWRESRRWDVLLAQNRQAEAVLRSAYAFGRRPIWVEGYPRNDALVRADVTAARAALGLAATDRVLLYAPTWRDDRERMVDFVDAAALAEVTDSVVLVRGHSRTLLPGADAAGARVIDVTSFPDTAVLMVAADMLITDYSSVMFDFSVTGKPMFFLVPDIAHYRGDLRGFYFDLAARAPGPLVTSGEELAHAIRSFDPTPYAARYDTWRHMFNARDDGHAANRVVARILDQGFVTR